MSRHLTKKQKAFADEIIKGQNGTKAALIAYDTNDYSTAGMIASENLTKPKIIDYLEEALPDEDLARVHKEGLSAKTYFNEIVGRDSKGAPIYNLKQIPDYSVRHRYLDAAYKVKGKYATEKSINLNVNAKDLEQVITTDLQRFRTGLN